MAGLLYLDGILLVGQMLIACLLHEAGHCGAAVCFGGGVREIRLTASGAEMKLDPNVRFSYVQDAVLALAGPAVNLFVAWLAVRCNTNLFAGLNLSFGLLNLLPVCPFDGGRIMTDLLSMIRPELAEKFNAVLPILLSGGLLGLGWATWHRWGNLSLLCTAIWFLFVTFRDKKLNK